MTVANIEVTTVTYQDPPHSNKYYSIYVLPNGIEIREYGPIGAQNPQYKVIDNGGAHAARTSAEKQLRSKEKKGYSGRRVGHFPFDMAKWKGDPKVVTNVHRASEVSSVPQVIKPPKQAKPASSPADTNSNISTPVQVDALDEFAARAANVITLSVTDESAALVEFAKLQGEWTEHEESYQKARSYLDTLEALVGK